jgi:hypothetical protein
MTKAFRQVAAQLRADNKQYTPVLQPVPVPSTEDYAPLAIWRSNRFLVQLFHDDVDAPQRLTVCRTVIDEKTGRWMDGITWDELQNIKSAVGFGDRFAIEIYPADCDVVNVSNMRHLWLVEPPAFAWRKK